MFGYQLANMWYCTRTVVHGILHNAHVLIISITRLQIFNFRQGELCMKITIIFHECTLYKRINTTIIYSTVHAMIIIQQFND